MKKLLSITISIYILICIPIVKSLEIFCNFEASTDSFEKTPKTDETEKYFCIIEGNSTIEVDENPEVVANFIDDNNHNEDVTGFSLSNYNINTFPQNVDLFKNLISLSISNCSLPKITQENLKPFLNLVILKLDLNKIEILPPELLKFNKKLKEIYLVKNQIFHIDPTVFEDLTELEIIDLRHNNCTIDETSADEVKRAVGTFKCSIPNFKSIHRTYIDVIGNLNNEIEMNEDTIKQLGENKIEDNTTAVDNCTLLLNTIDNQQSVSKEKEKYMMDLRINLAEKNEKIENLNVQRICLICLVVILAVLCILLTVVYFRSQRDKASYVIEREDNGMGLVPLQNNENERSGDFK